jgi:hypothetical protein
MFKAIKFMQAKLISLKLNLALNSLNCLMIMYPFNPNLMIFRSGLEWSQPSREGTLQEVAYKQNCHLKKVHTFKSQI